MAKKKYTEEQEREIEYLKANYEMLERTKEEAKLRGTEKSVQRIEMAQQDSIEQLKLIDPELVKELKLKEVDGDNFDILPRRDADSLIEAMGLDTVETNPMYEPINFDKLKNEVGVKKDFEFNNVDADVQYDIVELPSKGECYKDKFSRIPVGYLTAYDENFITSPNLYKDGLIIDYLLKHKIMNKNIDIEELCSGDVDAITLFLRITSYGPEYPIIARDPETGQEIETVIDLSKLEVKDFVLQGDDNGWFEYELPLSKDKVKFRFLTRKDKRMLDKLNEIEDYGIKASKVRSMMKDLVKMIKKDDLLKGKDKQVYIDNISKLEDWCLKMNEKEKMPYNKTITNRLELSIMSINGETDRSYIAKYVRNMPARDALMLRRYIIENEPGVNFEIEVPKPESLGGGSFKTFLEWEDTIFLNLV
jgi:hypothetical protein